MAIRGRRREAIQVGVIFFFRNGVLRQSMGWEKKANWGCNRGERLSRWGPVLKAVESELDTFEYQKRKMRLE